METQQHQFTTNINCGGCVASVKPHLDNVEGIVEWEVDTAAKNKLLTVTTEGVSREQVIKIVEGAGFTIKPLE